MKRHVEFVLQDWHIGIIQNIKEMIQEMKVRKDLEEGKAKGLAVTATLPERKDVRNVFYALLS